MPKEFQRIELTSVLLDATLVSIDLSMKSRMDKDAPRRRIGGELYQHQYECLKRAADYYGYPGTIAYIREKVLPDYIAMIEKELKEQKGNESFKQVLIGQKDVSRE